MPDQLHLQPALPGDQPAIALMMQQLRAEDPMPGSSLSTSLLALQDLLQDPSLGQVFLLRAGPSPIGYAVLAYCFSLELGGRIAFVDELFVAAAHRNQGHGARALQGLVDHARNLSLRALHLEVSPGNPALALYQRLGFTRRKYDLLSISIT